MNLAPMRKGSRPPRTAPFPDSLDEERQCLLEVQLAGRSSIRERLEREHRRRDFTGGRIGDRGRGLFEHEQSGTGDLARDRFAVADREERVAAPCTTSVGIASLGRRLRQRGLQLSLANAVLIWLAICTACSVPGVRSQMRSAVARAASGSLPRISAPAAANSATAAGSAQSGREREN